MLADEEKVKIGQANVPGGVHLDFELVRRSGLSGEADLVSGDLALEAGGTIVENGCVVVSDVGEGGRVMIAV